MAKKQTDGERLAENASRDSTVKDEDSNSNHELDSDFIEGAEQKGNDDRNCVLSLLVKYKKGQGKKIVKEVKSIPCSWNFAAYWNFYTKRKQGKSMLDEIVNKYGCSVTVCTDDEDFFFFEVTGTSFRQESDFLYFINDVLDNIYKHAQQSLFCDVFQVDHRVQVDTLRRVKENKELHSAWIEIVGEHDPDAVYVVCAVKDKMSVLDVLTSITSEAMKCYSNHEETVTVDFIRQRVLERFGYLQKLNDRFPNIMLVPNEAKHRVLLIGQRAECRAAADYLRKLVRIAQSEVHETMFSPVCRFEIFTYPEIYDYIDNSIRKLPVVWVPNNLTKKIHIFSKQPEQAEGVDKFIKGCIQERLYPLSKIHSLLFPGVMHLEKLKKNYKGKIMIHTSDAGLLVTMADDIFETVDAEIQEIISKERDENLSREIEVRIIPDNATEEQLLNFFENPKKGGGPVKEIQYNQAAHTAIVIFKSPKSVTEILHKQPCTFLGKTMLISVRVTPALPAKETTVNYSENTRVTGATLSIYVGGFNEETSEDALINYFENKKRTGGGEISSHQMNREEGYIIITFVHSSDAAEVLKHTHTLNNVTLTVRPHIIDDKLILVTGLTGKQSEENLQNFMEAKTKAEVQSITFSDDRTKAVVEFPNPCDLNAIKQACAKFKLEGVNLTVCPVPICNCIKVTNVPKGVSEDMIINYFENKRGSGGGTVERVEVNHSDGVCLVCFEDHEVVGEVCKRFHEIKKAKVAVQPYHSCLGKPRGHKAKTLLEPISIANFELDKRKFLMKNGLYLSKLENEMAECYSKVIWPSAISDEVRLECTLSSDVEDYMSLVETWAEKCHDCFRSFLDGLQSKVFESNSEEWDVRLEQLGKLHVSQPDKVAVFVDAAKYTVTFVGDKSVLPSIIKQVEEAFAAKQITKKCPVKNWQAKYLLAVSFPDEVIDQNWDVNIQIHDDEVDLTGVENSVNQVAIQMYSRLGKIVTTRATMAQEMLILLQKENVIRKVNGKLKSHMKICYPWEVKDRHLILYASTEEETQEMKMVLESMIETFSVQLEKETSKIINNFDWKKLKDKLNTKFPDQILISEEKPGEISVFSLPGITRDVKEQVEGFFAENTVYHEVLMLDEGVGRFIQTHSRDEVNQFVQGAARGKTLQISFESVGKVAVTGTKENLKTGKEKIMEMEKRIQKQQRTIQKQGIKLYIRTSKGKKCIEKAEKKTKCVIELKDIQQQREEGYARGREEWSSFSFLHGYGMSEAIVRRDYTAEDGMGMAAESKKYGEESELFQGNSNLNVAIYAGSKYAIDKAVMVVETTMDNDWTCKSINDPGIKHLKPAQREEINKTGKENKVYLKIDKKQGEIQVMGLFADVMPITDKIHQILREQVQKYHEHKEAQLPKNMVKWFYIKDKKEVEFPTDRNMMIEKAFQAKNRNFKLQGRSGEEFEIDFEKMVERPVKDPKTKFPVIRRDLIRDVIQVENPKHWTDMKSNENVKVVPLLSSDPQYTKVVNEFQQSVGSGRRIVKVERIQNVTLYTQYMAKMKQLDIQNSHKKNERILWHGTAVDAVDCINTHGFNRSYCGKSAVAIGNGVYFAVHASYSAQDTYSRPDANRHKRIYQCRVLTGDFAQGGGGMRVPPPKSSKQAHILYDSVVDNTNSPSMFVIFHDAQAYPDYLITFT